MVALIYGCGLHRESKHDRIGGSCVCLFRQEEGEYKLKAEFIIEKKGKIIYAQAPHIMAAGGLIHFFSTRFGGVSSGALSSLNLGVNRPDSLENVQENYRRICAPYQIDAARIVLSQQTHSTNIEIITDDCAGNGLFRPQQFRDVDGMVCATPDLAAVVFYADCVPVLLYDPAKQVYAVVHAGWRGTVGGIAAKAAMVMQQKFDSKPQDILAAIGPSIGPCHFETGKEVGQEFHKAGLGEAVADRGEKDYIDLWRANEIVLERAGLLTQNVLHSGQCTVCNKDQYFSHRGDGPDTGRCGLIAQLDR